MQFFMSFYGGCLKQQICYSFTLQISCMFLNPLKWLSSCSFPYWMVQIFFSSNSTGPGPDFRNRKIPDLRPHRIHFKPMKAHLFIDYTVKCLFIIVSPLLKGPAISGLWDTSTYYIYFPNPILLPGIRQARNW